MEHTTNTQGWQHSLIDQSDFLKEVVQKFLQNLLNEEFIKFIGAEEYERTGLRKGYRNGYYERQLKTRVGNLSLSVCRDRNGEFKTEIFERYQRSEKALIFGLLDMYFSGVATRKIEGIIETLCGFGISKSQVSSLTKTLDEDLKLWRERPLEKKYIYLILDAHYEKQREQGHVISKAWVVVVGITEDGYREIIGCYVINSESFEEWDDCIATLKRRGLNGVVYVVSDDNKGLKNAIAKHFQGALWQRCQVHFMRNFLFKLSKATMSEGLALLKEVFDSGSREEAKAKLQKVEAFLIAKNKISVWHWLEANIEDTLNVFALPKGHQKKMKSTNMLERLNQELKRRARVIRIFPNEESSLRLLTALCQEISEAWGYKKYMKEGE